MKNKLINKLKNNDAVIGIVGLGYVGLPLMLRYASIGLKVIGIDIDAEKINKINNGESYIEHISSKEIYEQVNSGNCSASSDFSAATQCDALILCVPTPLNKHREPDLSYVINTTEQLLPYIKKGQILSLESTTYPGTTEEELVTRVESIGYKIGEDFFIVYSPEREDPGNINFNTSTIPKICGGHTTNCLDVGICLYEKAIEQVVPVSSTKVAEMTKLLENIHRSVNIGLVNEMKIVADKMDIDIFEVIDAAATKPFGFTPYYPGPGLGGHCIPIDPFYLTWKAREYGLNTRFIELSGEINQSMPKYVVTKLINALNSAGKPLRDSKVLILGIAYKKNVDDMRESPSLKIMELLRDQDVDIYYSDPHVDKFPPMRDHEYDLKSVSLTKDNIKDFDALILSTNHDKFDYELIKNNAQLIIDTRGVYKEPEPHIIKS